MNRTVSLKLGTCSEKHESFLQTQEFFSKGCNTIVPFVVSNRCWNRVDLHHLCYYKVRENLPCLGSQMVCNALRKVCSSYKVLKIKKDQNIPAIKFKKSCSVHYCARTFSLKDDVLSLFSIQGRVKCTYRVGAHQRKYLEIGKIKEGELILRGKTWFFNLVLEIPEVPLISEGKVFAVDLGENNIATTSKGTIYGGGQLRHKRDKFLARRRKLQSNGNDGFAISYKLSPLGESY